MSLQTGDIGEAMFITACIKHGFCVSKPFSQDSRYDLIVDTGDKIYRVQVKSCARPNKRNRYEFNLGNGRKKSKYYGHDIDLVVCCCIDQNDFYFVFRETFENVSRINVYSNSNKYLKNIFTEL